MSKANKQASKLFQAGFTLTPIPEKKDASGLADNVKAPQSSRQPAIGVTSALAEGGFTVIELMVVVTIMMVMTGLMIVNLAGTRVNRNMKIAQNELISNLRKIQSYALSGRSEGINMPIQYYIMKIDSSAGSAAGYTIQAMYQDASGNWNITDTEKNNFPPGIGLASATPITITRPSLPVQNPTCALIAFKLPYGKIYFSPANTGTCDDSTYSNIRTFILNSFSGNPVSADSVMTLRLSDQNNTVFNSVIINGITSLISTQ